MAIRPKAKSLESEWQGKVHNDKSDYDQYDGSQDASGSKSSYKASKWQGKAGIEGRKRF